MKKIEILHECDQIRNKNMMLIGRSKGAIITQLKNPPYHIRFHLLMEKWSLNTPYTTYFEEIDHCPYCGFKLDKNLRVKIDE